MTKYSLTAPARMDVQEIVAYIEEDNSDAASAIVDRLFDRFVSIAKMPEIGRLREEFGTGLRSFPEGNYLIFYRLTSRGIEILRVLHSARDIEAIFDN